ncbi:LytR/AlgR family response regulator transcription factor [Muriicola sp. Z0-33]|uniref:LytR/AlgR family response regulator transcription factor n=1 Tax=Muriicola sp. Z0-33 TaxID=2816957 RepID=UPI0022387C96|nr:LytTR family DNA-binding domain-containing protein [Muriicola sp. Z0-33]MCW5516569.1 response regulator transcription factor [Muriicola sp. Z0-33]
MDYTYTIIDSEATSQLQLEHYLEDYGDFLCVAQARNSHDGLDAILKHLPDLVFVNLNETAYEYFHMVTQLHQYVKELPLVIGISRGKEYAYEALKNNFFDYWLMPYSEFDIRKTILKLRKNMPKEVVSQTLCLKSYKDFQYLETADILYLKADNNATDFIMRDGRTISAFKTLKSFEQQLPDNFIRIHQSYILNTHYVSRINYGKAICALKSGKTQLPFSKTYKQNIDNLKTLLAKNTITSFN